MATIDLPEDSRIPTILGFISYLEYETTSEFAIFLEEQFQAIGETNWFVDLRGYRLSRGDVFTYKSPKDLRFILGEATLNDSWISDLIPNINVAWTSNADNLRKKLNLFHHLQLKPDLHTLLQMARLFELVGDAPGLDIANKARAIQSRVKALLANEDIAAEGDPPGGAQRTVLAPATKRPPWGARWEGEKPSRKLMINRNTREIFNESGDSVTDELGENGREIVENWLRYFPMGGEIWVGDDGAVMGYLKGIPKMIGWFGSAPDAYKDSVRGFVLDHEYTFDGSDIIDSQSQAKLSEVASENIDSLIQEISDQVASGEKLLISEFGDIFVPLADGQPQRLTWAHKNVWFPGHLPE